MEGSPFTPAGDGVRVQVRLMPKAGRNMIAGLTSLPGGGRALRVRVTAAPERGWANQALIALLAREWGIPKGRIRLVAGETARDKILRVAGEGAALTGRLEAWLAGRSQEESNDGEDH
jgi:hypothetical protein